MDEVALEGKPVAVSEKRPLKPWLVAETDEQKLERYQDIALDVLEKHGFLHREIPGISGEKDEVIVCDLNRFRSSEWKFYRELRDRLGPIATHRRYGRNNVMRTFHHIFENLKVYSEEDFERRKKGEDVAPKSLFYLPENSEAALSVPDIRNSRFHLGMWELPTFSRGNYPTRQEGLESPLSPWEAITSVLIYHPQFGNGERDAQRRLMVTYLDGSRRPITSDFFTERGYLGKPEQKRLPLWRAKEFFADRCPRMLEKDLVRLEDFKVQAGSETAERFRVGAKPLSEAGLVMFEKTRYTLGRKYGKEKGTFLAYQLSPDFAAVVEKKSDGSLKLDEVFELRIADPTKAREVKTPTGEYVAVKMGGFRTFSPEEFRDAFPDTSAILENFEEFLQFSSRVSRETGLNLANFSLTEQWFATAVYQEYGEDPRFWTFLSRYHLDGLRTLMAMEGSLGDAQLVLEIGEKTDAKRIFGETAKILEIVTAYEEGVSQRLGDDTREYADDVALVILQHANRLLLSSVPILRGEVSNLDIHDVVNGLRSFREQVAETYRNFFGMKVDEGNYRQLLEVFKQSQGDPRLRALALTTLENQWGQEIKKEDVGVLRQVLVEGDRFYEGNKALFRGASETTGDTEAELRRFQEYLGQSTVKGVVLDIGCGDGRRITAPMAKLFEGEASVIGIDRVKPTAEIRDNLGFAQGDITHLPFPAESTELVTAHWSVVNDLLLRKQELGTFDEVARVLRSGGEFYFDVPYLEGGEGSWEEKAKTFREEHPASRFGMIVADFPGERAKHFQIFPESELDAMLESSGFSLSKKEVWRTKAGKPRLTYVAKLERKITPRRLH